MTTHVAHLASGLGAALANRIDRVVRARAAKRSSFVLDERLVRAVIALSASALAKDVARGQEAGFFRYLTKPVKLDALTAALTAAVS